MLRSKIEWTETTWNPIRGCSRISPGCEHCYAERISARFSEPGQPYHGLARRAPNGEARWTGIVQLFPEILERPLHWRNPRRVFVNSMSDLFHESLSNEDIDRVFAIMLQTPRHQYQILTKRAGRMSEYMQRVWPSSPRNIWLGVSVEDQEYWNRRVPILQNTSAAIRFLSIEPLLGPIKILEVDLLGIDWVIVGGESGPDARPLNLEWVRMIIAACKRSHVPIFVKQLGLNPRDGDSRRLFLTDKKGGDMAEWPSDLCIREYPKGGGIE